MRKVAPFLFLLVGCASEHAGDIGEVSTGLTVCAKGPTLEGVDVSGYQPNTDWVKVKASGRAFAIIKATEGVTYINPYFAQDWKGSKAAGVVRGAYHFFRSNDDPTMQADFFVKTMGPLADGDLPGVLDLETTDGQTAQTIASKALTFLARVESLTGRTPMVYTSPWFFDSTLGKPAGFAKYWLWPANWGVSCPNLPGSWNYWPVWQYADNGTVPGIAGTASVDLDKFNGTMADLMAFTTVTPRPTLAQLDGNEALSVVSWPDQHLELFARNATGGLVHLYTTGTNDTWQGPSVLDVGVECGSAASFWGAPWSYPEVFAPEAAGATGHAWWSAGKWNTLQPFGGGGLGLAHLATVVGSDGRTSVFALGNDGAIHWDFWDTTKNDWAGWQTLGAGTTGFVTGASPIAAQDGHLELFATDGQGVAWHDVGEATAASGWKGWEKLGGDLATRLVPVRWDDGHLEAFARGNDGHLWHTFFDGTAWQPITLVDAQTVIAGEPAAMAIPKEGPLVVARDATGTVVGLGWDAAKMQLGSFAPVGAAETVLSDPFGWLRGDGRPEVFAVGGAGQLVRTIRTSGAWSAWTPFGGSTMAISPCAGALPPPPDGGATDDGGLAGDDLGPGDDGGLATDGSATGDGAARRSDGGGVDAGHGKAQGGCGCALGGHDAGDGAAGGPLLALALAGLAIARRRRR